MGHVSFWREADRTLIAGDAFVTTTQESAYAVAVQRAEMHGPPMYYTVEWDKAARSVMQLAELEPELVMTGHGLPMRGPEMRYALHRLAREFDRVAVPKSGRYVAGPQGSRTVARTALPNAEADQWQPTGVLPATGRSIADPQRV